MERHPWQAFGMWTLLLATAALASTTWTLDVPASVEVGESIPVRVSVRNDGSKAVLVPGDLAQHLSSTVRYVSAGARNPAAGVSIAPALSVAMDSVSWETVEPGATYTVELAAMVPEGTMVGTYYVEVQGHERAIVGATAEVQTPRFLEVARVDVDARLILHEASELPAQITGLSLRGGELIAAVYLVNTTPFSVWVSRTFLPQCEGRAMVKQKEVGFELRTGTGGQAPTLDEDGLVLLTPGEGVAHEVSCGELPAKAKSIRVRVTLVPTAPAVPRRAESSRHVMQGSPKTPFTFSSASRLSEL